MRRIDGVPKMIKDLKQQRSDAQRQVFEAYVDYLFKVCYRYLSHREKAEDVLSQVFIKIFEHIAFTDIEEEGKLKAWMKRIAINECLQEIRKNDVFADSMELYEEVKESEIEADQELMEEDLVNVVLQLPVGYRTVFSLYVIEGYSHQEIAEKLAISVGTSKSQLSKARNLLKEQLMNLK